MGNECNFLARNSRLLQLILSFDFRYGATSFVFASDIFFLRVFVHFSIAFAFSPKESYCASPKFKCPQMFRHCTSSCKIHSGMLIGSDFFNSELWVIPISILLMLMTTEFAFLMTPKLRYDYRICSVKYLR